GVFDSEKKQFCFLDVDPLVVNPTASQRTLIAANPTARQSRIFFAGNGNDSNFGYVEADLDTPNPCSWNVVHFSVDELNGDRPLDQQACPGGCEFDGLGMLSHEDVAGDPYGRDLVILNDYYSGRVSVMQVDANGLQPIDTYQMPEWVLPSPQGNMCYYASPVQLPMVDRTRPKGDLRFTASFDSVCVGIFDDSTPSECGPAHPMCPLDVAPDGLPGANCPASGTC